MPLAFDTTSHGRVAFGFFNIESDMLLLEHVFFFADRFCEMVVQTTDIDPAEVFEAQVGAYEIADPKRVGHLMGAIQGVAHHGFLGRLYAHFPFPEAPGEFKQKPLGFMTRRIVKALISPFSRKTDLTFTVRQGHGGVSIGPYAFSRYSFQQLIEYVWQGGYPRWQAGVAPPYVIRMKKAVEQSHHLLLEGLAFDSE